MKRDDELREGGREPEAHVDELLDAYRTGELEAALRGEVEAHLEQCARCREDLEALASWTTAIERGYLARRAGAAGLEPDWAAQRAAIVARTSARGRAAEGWWPFRRWAPQIALIAVAALIVGVVWRENAREPIDASRPAEDGRTTVQSEDALGRAELRGRRAGEPAAAAPPADSRFAEEPPAALEKEAVREADERRIDRQEEAADRAAELSLAARPTDVERFERQARSALETRDTTAARRALALWSDTLASGADLAGEPAALADSLRELLEAAE